MSLLLRIEMILLALLIAGVVINSVNKKKMYIKYSLIWLVIAAALVVIAAFPGIIFWLCGLLGIQTPANLIYLLGIVALLLITFMQTSIISKQTERIKSLVQTVSIERYKTEQENKKQEEST
ncbi:MAG: DUF2304 domain-containing protein [Clostridia bacterium]|nr:DUF2304 domain-containing protein [Clostridia bacterium]